LTKAIESVTIHNTNDKNTRYVICSHLPRLEVLYQQGRDTIADWVADQKTTGDQRLNRELQHGSLI
jgi:hypothetical protein